MKNSQLHDNVQHIIGVYYFLHSNDTRLQVQQQSQSIVVYCDTQMSCFKCAACSETITRLRFVLYLPDSCTGLDKNAVNVPEKWQIPTM